MGTIHYVRQLVIGKSGVADRVALGEKGQHFLDILFREQAR